MVLLSSPDFHNRVVQENSYVTQPCFFYENKQIFYSILTPFYSIHPFAVGTVYVPFQASTLSSLNLPLSSPSTTSRELLSQFSTCSE